MTENTKTKVYLIDEILDAGDFMDNFEIRKFRLTDLNTVVQINRATLPENYLPFYFIMHHNQFPELFLVAESENKIVGYIMCRVEGPDTSDFADEKVYKGHVVSIAVLPGYRRIGIASSLLTRAMENMSKRGAKECYLEVRVSNYPAISLYKKLSFKIVRRITGYYRDGEDAYVMARQLTSE